MQGCMLSDYKLEAHCFNGRVLDLHDSGDEHVLKSCRWRLHCLRKTLLHLLALRSNILHVQKGRSIYTEIDKSCQTIEEHIMKE